MSDVDSTQQPLLKQIKWLQYLCIIISLTFIGLSLSIICEWQFNLTWVDSLSDRLMLAILISLGSNLSIISLILNRDRQAADRARAEIKLALEQSKAKYKAIVEEQAELICRYRQDGTVSYVNDAFCRYFEIEKAGIIDRQYSPVVYEADLPRVQQLIRQITPDNPIVTIENRVIVNNTIRWTQWNNRLIFDDAGNSVEYQAVGRDITPIKKIELKLRESEEKFRRAFEGAATGEALVSADGAFIRVNRSLCEMIGYQEAELVGKTFQEITHPEDLDLDLDYLHQMLAGKIRTYQMEKRYFHKQGHLVWALLSVSMVRDLDEQPLYFISQIQDISQRKSAEHKLNSLITELERSNQELDEFATVVSHDLISPLRRQISLISVLKEEYGEVLEDTGLDYCDRIIGYNAQMNDLVRSLLAYARIATKAQSFSSVNLNTVIDNILDNLKPEIERTEANIKVANLPTVWGDRLQLNQLFLNLLQNALKFHRQDRAIEIKIEYHLANNHHQIAIADNGIGFDKEQKLKIFMPFHRLHSQSKYQGTGLGLAICEKIIERHQGKITAHSSGDLGAVFTVCLPVALDDRTTLELKK